MDLVSLCNLIILGNVLDFRTYSAPNQAENGVATSRQSYMMAAFDQNDIPSDERMAICYTRGVAIFMLRSIREHCLVVDADGNELDDLPTRHLARQMRALISYKKAAVLDSLKGAPHCTLNLLELQIENLAAWDSDLSRFYEEGDNDMYSSKHLSFETLSGILVHWVREPQAWVDGSTDFLLLGSTGFDRKFFATSLDFHLPKRQKMSL